MSLIAMGKKKQPIHLRDHQTTSDNSASTFYRGIIHRSRQGLKVRAKTVKG